MPAAAGRTIASVVCLQRRSKVKTGCCRCWPACRREITDHVERNMTVAKTGADHIASLRDGRTVYIDGQLVPDVTTHPAFRNTVRSAGALYDFQARPENIELMTFRPEGSNRRVNRAWQMPRSYEEMVQRRKALQAWTKLSCGFMGRSPDHVASSLIGQRMGIEVFRKHDPDRAKALIDYVDYATKNDIFLTYVIINPQAERA